MVDYLVRFAANLDPNGATGIAWPKYTNSSPQLMTFQDGVVPLTITQDTFRQQGIAYLIQLSLVFPL